MSATDEVRRHLRRWAADSGVETDSAGYVQQRSENFFTPLSGETLLDLGGGAGGELGGEQRRGKAQALHSSAALALNVFEYWRQREDRRLLELGLGLASTIKSLGFEKPFTTGLRGTPPHLDVVVEHENGLVAIESKFLEPYGGKKSRAPFAASYFPTAGSLWLECGLPRCQELAGECQEGVTQFELLDVGQLLKHALGIGCRGDNRVALWYLWYDVGGSEGENHRREVAAFKKALGNELGFRATTYQALIHRMGMRDDGEHQAYCRYLCERYSLSQH